MTATVTPIRTNGKRRPVVVAVDRAELVGTFMDGDTLATEAAYANGAALQYLLGMPRDAAIEQAIRATHETHDKLVALIRRMRIASGTYDKPSEGA